MRHLNPKAILIGLAVDVVGSIIAVGAVASIFGVMMVHSGVRPSDLGGVLDRSASFHLAGLLLGLSFTALAGYVAARRAPAAELPNALAVGLCSTALGVTVVLLFQASPVHRVNLLANLLTPPAAVFGGYLQVLAQRASAHR